MIRLVRDIRWASTASDQCRKPKCENRYQRRKQIGNRKYLPGKDLQQNRFDVESQRRVRVRNAPGGVVCNIYRKLEIVSGDCIRKRDEQAA